MVIGTLGALAVTRVLGALLYGVAPTDPLILAAVPFLVIVTAGVHSAANVAFLWLVRHRGMALTTAAGIATGAAVLLFGLWLHAR